MKIWPQICKRQFLHYTLPVFCGMCFLGSFSQNSMIGDGFGGRLWYKPYNYTVGSYSAYTVCGDSFQLYGWGSNVFGQLGDGTNNSTVSPVKAIGMTNVRYYSTGYMMGAIKFDGSAWVWGAPNPTPRKVLDNVKFMDAGIDVCVFVKDDSTVWSINNNASGTTKPSQIKGINSAVRVANGLYNNIILLYDGTLMATGYNFYGNLGNNSSPNVIISAPVAVNKLNQIVDIKSTTFTHIALDSSGNVYSWGRGIWGALGNGQVNNVFEPAKISGLKNIVAISGSNDGGHFLALDNQHNCYGWGYNGTGALGDGTKVSQSIPVLVATDVIDIMAGETFSYLVKSDGTLWCTGTSKNGSIWMNLKDTPRYVFTKIDPTLAPLNLCRLSRFSGNYFSVLTTLCVYDSIQFKAYKNDSFKNYCWTFGDGSPLVYGTSPLHKYQNTGTYQVKMMSVHIKTGRRDTVIRSIDINDASYEKVFDEDTAMCGKPFFIKTPKNFEEYNRYQWNDGPTSFARLINYPGSYILRITEANGCHYDDTFNVISHPIPKAQFKADVYSICANNKQGIKFSNLSTCPDSIVKCDWDFTQSTMSTTDSVIIYKYKKADIYPVFLTVYTQYGCKNDTIDVVEILPAPQSKFDLQVNDSCLNGNSITLKNNTLKDSVQNPRFKWYFSEGAVMNNRNPSVPRSYVTAGKYYIDLIYENANKCADTLRKYITIYPHPHADFSFKKPPCSRDSITFYHTSTSTYQPLTSKWIFDDVFEQNTDSAIGYYQQKGYYKIKLISRSPQGCLDSISKNLQIFDPPIADFSINDTLQCLSNNSFQFISLSIADTGILAKKNWNYSDYGTDTGKIPSAKSFSSSGKFRITHYVEDMFACKDSISKWVEVKNEPLVNFSINDPSQCEDMQDFVFSYRPESGNDSIIEVKWLLENKTYTGQQVLQMKTFPAGNMPVTLTLTTKYGCQAFLTKSVIINPKPQAVFTLNDAVQCFDGHHFDFANASGIASGRISTYDWQFGDQTSSKLIVPPPKTYNQIGTYRIILAIASDSFCVDTTSTIVTIHPNPFIDMAAVNPVCKGLPCVFTNKSSISSGNIRNYSWNFGDNDVSTDIHPSHIYPGDGWYNVTLTATSDLGCSSSKVFNRQALVFPLPDAQLTYDILDGQQNNNIFRFRNTTYPVPVYSFWNFGPFGQAIHDTAISIQDTTTIHVTLLVVDSNGCVGTTKQSVFAYGPLLIFFPNAFTPGNDLVNDVFFPKGVVTFKSYDFNIYNRWGEHIYQSSGLDGGWDGTYQGEACQEGVYVYLLNLIDMNGQIKTYRGTFTLLR